jgi:hypothetical protein
MRIAIALGWVLVNRIEPNERQPFEEIWSTPDGRTILHYVEDFILNLRFVAIQGENREATESQLRYALVDAYERAEVLQIAEHATTREESMRAITLVAASASDEPDPEFVKHFRATFAHDEVDVRRLAIFAVAYTGGWPELLESLEHMSSSDPEPEIRDLARRMLVSLKGERNDADA